MVRLLIKKNGNDYDGLYEDLSEERGGLPEGSDSEPDQSEKDEMEEEQDDDEAEHGVFEQQREADMNALKKVLTFFFPIFRSRNWTSSWTNSRRNWCRRKTGR